MGSNIAELATGGVIVRTIGAGTSSGFSKPTPAFAVSTVGRSAEQDYVVLSREEGILVSLAILKDELQRKKYNDEAITEMAGLLNVDLRKLIAFE